jgi:2,3-bisphosphoglycerate-dependent phosphoglycerate mutase
VLIKDRNEGNFLDITTFYIVRHGETEWNKHGLLQGNLDSPLSELGIRQADALGQYFTQCEFDHIITSDLSRAVMTAQKIADTQKKTLTTDIRLRERNLGIAQGLTLKDFSEKYPYDYKCFSSMDAHYVIPGGESILQRYTRCVESVNELAAAYYGKTIVVVTHGGVLDALFRYVSGVALDTKRTFSLFNASVNTIQCYKNEWYIVTWGYVEHLRGLGALDGWYKGAI